MAGGGGFLLHDPAIHKLDEPTATGDTATGWLLSLSLCNLRLPSFSVSLSFSVLATFPLDRRQRAEEMGHFDTGTTKLTLDIRDCSTAYNLDVIFSSVNHV